MLLLIDNYDSFTYNLVQYFQILKQEVIVFAHDKITLQSIKELAPDHLVISPGPKNPDEAGISLETIKTFYKTIPILGVCLGHQCIGQAFGTSIINAPEIMHGKTSLITHNYQNIFANIPNEFRATRYHSLCIDPVTLPDCFSIDAWANNTIMAISHRQFPVFGLQFHPEAILSQYGLNLLENFLRYESQSAV
ncbi:MAG TPA: aminodeoxychorismate/anthranilate synthase component II [Legionella sp.]|nr:aminodeoxychorismate/anthranilate synthase component II [Legionella sp.]